MKKQMNFNSKYRFYISGAITGHDIEDRKVIFRKAESTYLTYFGFAVNPFDIKPLFGLKNWAFYMASDIWYLVRYCNAVYMLKGARIEHRIAKLLNYTITYEK